MKPHLKTNKLTASLSLTQSEVVHEASVCVVAATHEVLVSTHTVASRIVQCVRHGWLGGGGVAACFCGGRKRGMWFIACTVNVVYCMNCKVRDEPTCDF